MMVYDESNLIKMLDNLPKEFRVGFAVLCADRLMPAYVEYATRIGNLDSTLLTSILGRLWRTLGGHWIPDEEIQSNLDTCMALIHTEDEGKWSSLRTYAEDAVAAVAYALRVQLNGESQESAWAARRVYEALDHFVTEKESADPTKIGSDKFVIYNSLIQQELKQQRTDLDNLNRLANQGGDINQIRTRAANAYNFLAN